MTHDIMRDEGRSGTPRAPEWSPRYTVGDRLIMGLDALVGRRWSSRSEGSAGPDYPAGAVEEAELSARERHHAAGLMRVNHAGEVAAQALYEGQAVFARSPRVRRILERAAAEEANHLAWCGRPNSELVATPSRLDPLWYAGSFAIGALAAVADDATSLGFVAETERQVGAHLERHLRRLAPRDRRSRAVLEQMARDEARHETRALAEGGRRLPLPVRLAMRLASRVMTRTAYWV
jgi:3-demethoxyubiquinol 3-hydroxylase